MAPGDFITNSPKTTLQRSPSLDGCGTFLLLGVWCSPAPCPPDHPRVRRYLQTQRESFPEFSICFHSVARLHCQGTVPEGNLEEASVARSTRMVLSAQKGDPPPPPAPPHTHTIVRQNEINNDTLFFLPLLFRCPSRLSEREPCTRRYVPSRTRWVMTIRMRSCRCKGSVSRSVNRRDLSTRESKSEPKKLELQPVSASPTREEVSG